MTAVEIVMDTAHLDITEALEKPVYRLTTNKKSVQQTADSLSAKVGLLLRAPEPPRGTCTSYIASKFSIARI